MAGRPIAAPGYFCDQREFARVHIVEHRPGALVEHVGVEIIAAQQRHPVLPRLALGACALDVASQRRLMLGEILLGLQPVRAGVGRQAEIADDQRRDGVEAERGQDGAQSRAGDHARKHRGAALRER